MVNDHYSCFEIQAAERNRKRQKGNRKGYGLTLGEGERERRSKTEQSKRNCTHETGLKFTYNIKELGGRFIFKQMKKKKITQKRGK